MGPIAGVDSDSRSYVCHACGYEGLPIFFDTEAGRAQFEREKKGIWEAEPATKKGPVSIPILPIQTDPLIDMKVLDLLPWRVVAVTGVRWEAGGLAPTGYRVSFQEYWDAIGGAPAHTSRIQMLALTGTNPADPEIHGAPTPTSAPGVGSPGRIPRSAPCSRGSIWTSTSEVGCRSRMPSG